MSTLRPTPRSTTSLLDRFLYHVETKPSARALVYLDYLDRTTFQEQTHTFATFANRVHTVAQALTTKLQSLPFPSDGLSHRALVSFAPGLRFAEALWACIATGTIAIPVPPIELPFERSLPRMLSIIDDAQPTLLLTEHSLMPLLDAARRLYSQLDALPALEIDALAQESTTPLQSSLLSFASASYNTNKELKRPVLLQYTSGSTSTAKGVVLTQENLLQNISGIDQLLGHATNDIACSWLPTFHSMGMMHAVIHPLTLGFPCYSMSPTAFMKHPERWFETIARYQVTHSGAPNFAYDLCARRIKPNHFGDNADRLLSSWQAAYLAAEPIRAETLRTFAERFRSLGFTARAFCPGYGLTEATTRITATPHDCDAVILGADTVELRKNRFVAIGLPRDADDEGEPDAPTEIVSCGVPLPQNRVIIVEPERNIQLADDSIGEIWIEGPAVGNGYWKRPRETHEVFGAILTDDPHRTNFLRTGDLGFLHQGHLFVTGRLKDIIIIRGRNYYPQDLEHHVEGAFPSIRPGCSIAFSVEARGAKGIEERLVIVAEVERRREGRRSETALPLDEDRRKNSDRRNFDLFPGFDPDQVVPFDAAEIKEAIQKAIAKAFMLKAHDVVLIVPGTIPKTASQKLQRHACKQAYLGGNLQRIDI